MQANTTTGKRMAASGSKSVQELPYTNCIMPGTKPNSGGWSRYGYTIRCSPPSIDTIVKLGYSNSDQAPGTPVSNKLAPRRVHANSSEDSPGGGNES